MNAHFILLQPSLAQQGEASKLLASPTTSTAVEVVQLQDISIHREEKLLALVKAQVLHNINNFQALY